MMKNNWQRFHIWQGLSNRFDYREFAAVCQSQGLSVMSAQEFAQQAGMLMVAATMYPDRDVKVAYALMFHHTEAPEVSRGLGDTVAKIATAIGADKLAAQYTAATGKDCGCKGRQDALNRLVPYAP